jgi:hypothetical protein
VLLAQVPLAPLSLAQMVPMPPAYFMVVEVAQVEVLITALLALEVMVDSLVEAVAGVQVEHSRRPLLVLVVMGLVVLFASLLFSRKKNGNFSIKFSFWICSE